MLVEPIFKNLSIHPCSFPAVIWAGMQFTLVPFNDNVLFIFAITTSLSLWFPDALSQHITIKCPLDNLCVGEHFCLSNKRVFVGKLFQCQHITSPLHYHNLWNKPLYPSTNIEHGALKKRCL
jgi:hypothetical protein